MDKIMTAPRTDIERAFAYAEHHPQNGLTVSPQLAQDQKVVQYQRIVLQLKDTGALINLQIQLDQDLPYFALCSDENLQAYFGRWKLPIESKADLQLFSEVLSERIREAATSDSTAQQYLQQKEYQTQLRELPQAVSQLESTIKEYDVLKAPFTAVMRYVYAAVSQGFSMTENGNEALEKYPARIKMKKKDEKIETINFDINFNTTTIAFEIYPEIVKITSSKKNKIRKLREYLFGPTQSQEKLRVDFVWTSYMNNWSSRRDPEEVLNIILSNIVNITSQEEYLQNIQQFFRIIFNLPKYMHNYAVKTRQNVSSTLDSILKETPKEE